TVLWKPSELALATSAAIHNLLVAAGLGPYVEMASGGPDVGRAVVEAGCDKYVLIGGVQTGRTVLESLGRQIRPAVAELSGSDPMLVCADADLETAARAAVWGRLLGSGQTCMAPRRIYVERSAYPRFLGLVAEQLSRVRLGDPLSPETDLGPVRTAELRERALAFIDDAVDCGARLISGGQPVSGPGFYLTPALLADCTEEMRVFQEDLFAPVIGLAVVESAREAVERIRAYPFALTSSVWSRDTQEARRLAAELPGGVVSLNEIVLPCADPAAPFGGAGSSGYGRMRGAEGLREMVQPRVLDEGPLPSLPRMHMFPYGPEALAVLKAAAAQHGGRGAGVVGALKALISHGKRSER
ncbi:MAG: gabD, partial [Armatimonadetes bacterium]|nr:gabD [Armatimonadota bacterium]